jgi:hypothetical protein
MMRWVITLATFTYSHSPVYKLRRYSSGESFDRSVQDRAVRTMFKAKTRNVVENAVHRTTPRRDFQAENVFARSFSGSICGNQGDNNLIDPYVMSIGSTVCVSCAGSTLCVACMESTVYDVWALENEYEAPDKGQV